jgi:hypothetical protein
MRMNMPPAQSLAAPAATPDVSAAVSRRALTAATILATGFAILLASGLAVAMGLS